MNINIKNAMFYLLNELFKFKKKRIFVIGGSGLIGSQLCILLSKLKAKVFNLDITNKLKTKK